MNHHSPLPRFLLGGSIYCIIEILWRGYTHISMFLLGGFVFRVLARIGRLKQSFFSRVMLSTGAVTAAEFCSGILLNRIMQLNVWDYSDCPMNLLGQICLPYMMLWMPLCAAGMLLNRMLDRFTVLLLPAPRRHAAQ